MRPIRQWAGILVSFCLLLTAALPVLAAEEEYTYTVRIYAGRQGTIGGSEEVVYEGLRYGERVTFNQNSVTLDNGSKYYVRGLKQSGRDNETSVATASFVVTEDADYVVSYGLLGSSVAYNVNYVDESDRSLADSETYYGNVGDRPVVAFQYVEGYQPQAYNLTGTLKENASENVFTFVYHRIGRSSGGTATGSGTTGGTGGTTGGTSAAGGTTTGSGTAGGAGTVGGTAAGTGTIGGAGTAGGTAAGTGAAGGTGTGGQTGGDAAGTEDGEAAEGQDADAQDEMDQPRPGDQGNTEPQEILDVDGQVPLAENMNMNNTKDPAPDDVIWKVPAAMKAGICMGILAAAAAMGYLIRKKRVKKDDG